MTTHPLQTALNMADQELDIEKEYSMEQVPAAQSTVTPVTPPIDVKDEDDKLIEKRIDEVYEAAMGAFNNQQGFVEIVDPKFAARNAEVAANYLNIALQAANSRSNVKRDRKRANQPYVPYNPGGKTTLNVITASRNDILKMITVDGEPKKVE